MRLAGSLALVLLLAALLPLAGTAGAGPSSETLRIDVDETFSGADTYMFSIQIDPRQGDPSNFTIANDSHFTVEGHYDTSNGSAPQDAAGLRGVVGYNSWLGCAPCFMDASGVSKKEVWDAHVEADGFSYRQDPNLGGWGSAEGGIWWDSDARFEVPSDAEQLTVRFFLTIPGAERIDVDVHIHSPEDITIKNEIVNDGGFAASGDDFDPTYAADTAAGSAMVDGRQTVELPSGDDRLFAGFGPSWHGQTSTGLVRGQHNTAALSSIAYEDPSGERFGGIAIGLGTWNGIRVTGSNEAGTHTFDVRYHAGAGPQDVYLVGYEGPTS